nr:hypothetical protein [uncultured Carboxylicivirga sp.]
MRNQKNSEILIFLKESELADKRFYIFQNELGELRAVESVKFNLTELNPGDKLTAEVFHKGCAGREIHQITKMNDC